MAIAAFATACQVEDLNEANQGQQNGELFTIEAAITPSTKTSLTVEGNAYKVDWDADDALSVVAKYSDGSYSGNEFTKGEGNTFSGTVTNPGDITELNVVYPYDDYIKDIDSEGYFNGYVYFGSRSDESQNQTGLNSAAHINGPLYGYATVSSENTVVQMKHASTLFEINVTNNSGIDINVSNIKLTNSESKNMVGTFYINPQTGALKEGQYVASTVSLNASNATITNGETGSFYITSAPFELAANSNITVTVTANGQETEIVKTVSEATSFVAGTVNHLNVTIKEAQEIQPIEEGQYLIGAYASSIWHLMSSENSNNRYTSTKTVVNAPIDGINCNEFYYIANIDDYIWTIESYEGGYTLQSNKSQLYVSPNSKGNASAEDAPVALSIIANTDGSHTITKVGNSFELMKNSSSDFFAAYEGTQTKIALIPWIPDTTPRIFVEETAISAPAGSSTGSLSYRVRNANADDLTVSIKESASWITAENVPADNKISYEIQANDGIERTATIILSLSGTEDIEIPVTQLAAGEVIYTLTITPEDFPGGSYADNNGSHLLTATGSDGSEKEISIYTNQIMKQSTIQFQKGKGYFYNETSFTEIVSIELSNATGSFSMHIGDSENPTSGSEVINANNIFIPTVQANYFVVNCGNSTGKCSEIIIKFKME